MPGKKVPEEARREQILGAALEVALRERLEGLTVRTVAREAGVSPGLVFFHFTNKEALLVELLEWLLQTTIVAEVGPEVLDQPTAAGRLLALCRQELQHLLLKRARLELFFDYWVLGSRYPAVRALIRGALDRYRAAFQPFAAAIIEHNPERFKGTTPEGLAMAIVSMIQGCAVYVIKEPQPPDLEPLLETAAALLGAAS